MGSKSRLLGTQLPCMRRISPRVLLLGLIGFALLVVIAFTTMMRGLPQSANTPSTALNAFTDAQDPASTLRRELLKIRDSLETKIANRTSQLESRLAKRFNVSPRSYARHFSPPMLPGPDGSNDVPLYSRSRQTACIKRHEPNGFLDFVVGAKKFKDKKIFIAANLFNSQHILSDWLVELQRLIQFLGPENVFVSLYESGSQDATRSWLLLFEQMMTQFGVDHKIVKNGVIVRLPGSHRIDLMSHLRNAALKPLYNSPKGTYDYVVMLNDILYCAEDVIRLLMYRADMACGMDFIVNAWAADKANPDLQFYDTWVALDVAGEKFDPSFPFVMDDPSKMGSVDRMKAGKPFPVLCCWNGLVAIRAEVFYSGLRFRRGYQSETECSGAECSLLCKDMWKKNFTRILMDPMVQITYKEDALQHIERFRLEHFPKVVHPVDINDQDPEDEMNAVFAKTKYASTWACCGLEGDGDRPDTGCRYYFTEIAGAVQYKDASTETPVIPGAQAVSGLGKVRADQRCGEYFPAPDGTGVSVCAEACCSASGWCGATAEHCCADCADYRTSSKAPVASAPDPPPATTTTSTTTVTTTETPGYNPAQTLISKGWVIDVSNLAGKTRSDLRCGFSYNSPDGSGPAVCHDSCCSLSGWCGVQEEHCCPTCADFRLARPRTPLMSQNFPIARLATDVLAEQKRKQDEQQQQQQKEGDVVESAEEPPLAQEHQSRLVHIEEREKRAAKLLASVTVPDDDRSDQQQNSAGTQTAAKSSPSSSSEAQERGSKTQTKTTRRKKKTTAVSSGSRRADQKSSKKPPPKRERPVKYSRDKPPPSAAKTHRRRASGGGEKRGDLDEAAAVDDDGDDAVSWNWKESASSAAVSDTPDESDKDKSGNPYMESTVDSDTVPLEALSEEEKAKQRSRADELAKLLQDD